jgi:aminoglycoside phosphotransferase family enzyme
MGSDTLRAEMSTEEKVRFLSAVESYPHLPAQVEVVETHLSWVFLAGERVYKLKKPIRSEYFDFTSLAGREANCQSEVRLNRRLAAEVYQGVARLVQAPDGRLSVGGRGETIDWLVVMRRLPADRMLDRMIACSALDPPDLGRLGARLAAFYATQPPSPIAPAAYVARYAREQDISRAVFALCERGLPSRYAGLLDRLEAALAAHSALLEGRVRSGRVVDGHGDLRPEHVCMNDPIVIFDCLEFSDELRQVDPVDELAFLGMECAMLGAAWIGPRLMAEVMGRLGEHVPVELHLLHTALHASLRARLTLAHVLDPVPRQPEKWRPLAERYAEAAESALASLEF